MQVAFLHNIDWLLGHLSNQMGIVASNDTKVVWLVCNVLGRIA